jgi:predicted DNA-binding protein with PD1-like motif
LQSAEYDPVKSHVLRLSTDEDLINILTQYVNEKNIDAADVHVIGAVQDANLGFYDQDEQEYEEHYVDEPMELLQATGNVSYLDGERFVHLHGSFSDEDDNVVSGHIFEGTTLFAGEAIVHELDGPPLRREDDERTGLTLWEF